MDRKLQCHLVHGRVRLCPEFLDKRNKFSVEQGGGWFPVLGPPLPDEGRKQGPEVEAVSSGVEPPFYPQPSGRLSVLLSGGRGLLEMASAGVERRPEGSLLSPRCPPAQLFSFLVIC